MFFKKKDQNFLTEIKYFKFFVVLFFLIISFLLGAYSHKTHFFYTFAKPIVYENLGYIKKIFKGKIQKVDKLNLNIKFENLEKLEKRNILFVDNSFIDPNLNNWLPITIDFQGKSYKSKIRFKGREPETHLNATMRSKNKSYKVKIKKSQNGNILNMREFNLMDLRRRGYLREWYARKFLKTEGLIYLDYKFVNLFINGEDHGIYAIDENISESTLTKSKRRDGVAIRLDNNSASSYVDLSFTNGINSAGYNNVYTIAEIDGLNESFEKKFSEPNKKRIKDFIIASKLLDKFRRNELKAEEVFDLDQLARGFAASDILDGWHGVNWTNMSFYLNPVSLKLEPIFQDWYNEGSISTGNEELRRSIRLLDIYNYGAFYKNIFASKKFLKKYIYYLEQYSSDGYMKKFHEKVKKEFDESLNTIYKSSPYYNFPFNEIQRKIKEIQSFIYHYDPVHISLWSQQENIPLKTEIKLGNKHIIPIIINKIIFKSPEGLVYVKNTNLELKPRDLRIFTDKKFSKAPVNYKIIKLDSPNFSQYETLAIEYNILGSEKKLYKEILRPIENSIRDEIDIDNFLIKDDNFTDIKNLEFIEIYNNDYVFKKGIWNINSDLKIPRNKKLIISGGTKIILSNGAKIISKSPIIAKGFINNKIYFESSIDFPGQCILIMDTKEVSIFDNVEFNQLQNCKNGIINSEGALNVYKSKIRMKNIIFKNNTSGDDGLNFINSEFKLKNIELENIFSDGIDLDYSVGIIENFNCKNCNNDGIDLSNTTLELNGYSSLNTGDKSISVGENSILEAKEININKTKIGIAIKDGSKANLKNLNITSSEYPVAVYVKKQAFGPGNINIINLNLKDNINPLILEKGSVFNFDKKSYPIKIKKNVFTKIYP